MKSRKIGSLTVSAVSLGCMNLSHAYGTPPDLADAENLLNQSLDMGYTMLDTATIYGFGTNEELISRAVGTRRSEYTLASKCGLYLNDEGNREINGRPEVIKRQCEASLKRLGTDVIDLYYLHRFDKNVPIEESVGALSELVTEGKIREVGLSEISADTLRKACTVHPVAAVQNEYSLWTRNPEIGMLDACKELGVAFVAFSPVARGFFSGDIPNSDHMPDNDLRKAMPRFYPDNHQKNQSLTAGLNKVSSETGVTNEQLLLAWLLKKREDIIPIPGTTNLTHLKDNLDAMDFEMSAAVFDLLDTEINQNTVHGTRYNPVVQKNIDSEMFPGEYDE